MNQKPSAMCRPLQYLYWAIEGGCVADALRNEWKPP